MKFLLEKLTVAQLFKISNAFYRALRIITEFTTALLYHILHEKDLIPVFIFHSIHVSSQTLLSIECLFLQDFQLKFFSVSISLTLLQVACITFSLISSLGDYQVKRNLCETHYSNLFFLLLCFKYAHHTFLRHLYFIFFLLSETQIHSHRVRILWK
jgi:hypothetical protein